MQSQALVAYQHIRNKIVSGEYQPDRFISTNALTSELPVSRTPIRDALHQLEKDGLVTLTPHYGAQVRSVDAQNYRELCELRLALEGFAAGLAAEYHTKEDLALLKVRLDALREMTHNLLKQHYRGLVPKVLVQRDEAFHEAVIRASHNRTLQEEVSRLQLIQKVMARPQTVKAPEVLPGSYRETLASHKRIYEAIARRDSMKARIEMEKHIQAYTQYVKTIHSAEKETMSVTS